MITVLNKTKISILSLFYLFCVIIYAGNATVFARSLGDPTSLGNAFGLLVMFWVFFLHKISFKLPYLLSLGVFLFYAVVTTINNWMISPMWISHWLIFLTMAYVLCHDLKSDLFVAYESILYILCIIALVLWWIGLFSPSTLQAIVHTFSFSQPYGAKWGFEGMDCNVLDNMLVFTLGSYYQGGDGVIARNPGFAWEPGAFSTFICLALACNMIRTNFRLKKNVPLFVFVGTLLSTQSTTGCFIFGAMLIIWLFVNKKFGYIIILLPVILLMYNFSFVGEKMVNEWARSDARSVDEVSSNFSMGRFQSFWLEWEEFLKHPIIGLGGYYKGAEFREYYSSFSGIGQLFSRYGIVLAILFFVLLGKSVKSINKTFQTKNALTLVVVVLGMMISYSLWEQPLYMSFWLYGFYFNNRLVIKKTRVLTSISEVR